MFRVLSLVAHFLYWSGIVVIVNEERPVSLAVAVIELALDLTRPGKANGEMNSAWLASPQERRTTFLAQRYLKCESKACDSSFVNSESVAGIS